jgi:hypothetical protein
MQTPSEAISDVALMQLERLRCTDAFYRLITEQLEPAAFAILEAEFAKRRGKHSVGMEVQGQVIALATSVLLDAALVV